jgi:hypothetical protein
MHHMILSWGLPVCWSWQGGPLLQLLELGLKILELELVGLSPA